IGILLALQARKYTGRGQHVDAALYDCSFPLLHPHFANWLQGAERTPLSGNQHPTFTPMGVYPTASHPIYLAVSTDRNFSTFCELMGHPEWAQDPRFRDMASRARYRVELIAIVT